MEKINFVNNTTPALNATNLNKLQDNIEDAFTTDVVESGSNANGNYIKYVDGTMICTKHIAGTTDVTTTWGSLYEGSINAGNYAQEFISTPMVGATPVGGNGCLIQCFHNTTASSFGTLYISLSTSFPNRQYTIDLTAIGKWK